MAGEYQFSLIDVTKQQGTKTILKDVNLSFFYGAHIGVIGGNGAGKSSLLKILAGLDTELMGTVQVAKGTKVGYLPQEPVLDDSKTVLETVMEGVADAQIRGGIGVALSPLVQRTMAVGRLTLLEVDLSAMFAFEKFQHHVRSRLAARPMGAKETRGVLE